MMNKPCGYTLFELVIIIVLLGILSVFVIPRIDLAGFRSTGFSQQALASIRFAQKLAISSGCGVEVEISGANPDVCQLRWSGCAGNASIANPASGQNDFCADSTPIGVAPSVNFTYDLLGVPSSGQSFTVDGRTFIVEPNTGFVYEP